MDDERKDKVIVMNRAKTGSRDMPEGISPADLLDGSGTSQPDRAAAVRHGREAVAAPELVRDAGESPEPGAGPECYDAGSSDYKAFGWAGNKTMPALIVILKDGSARAINYCDLATACPGGSMFLPSAPGCKGNVIRLLVAGVDGAFLIVIEGRRLWRLWELIMGHKTPWIHELAGGGFRRR